MTKYLLKFIQNAFIADQICFMKNWDFITSDFNKNSNLYQSIKE